MKGIGAVHDHVAALLFAASAIGTAYAWTAQSPAIAAAAVGVMLVGGAVFYRGPRRAG
jgi:hypothetical protein